MIKKKDLSQEDKKTWEDYIKDPSDIYDKDKKKRKVLRKERFKFDLHGYSIEKANSTIEQIISKCYENGIYQILVITGKGIHSKNESNVFTSNEYNKLKSTIPLFIKNKPDLASKIKNITTAPTKQGGEGALIIKLKKPIK